MDVSPQFNALLEFASSSISAAMQCHRESIAFVGTAIPAWQPPFPLLNAAIRVSCEIVQEVARAEAAKSRLQQEHSLLAERAFLNPALVWPEHLASTLVACREAVRLCDVRAFEALPQHLADSIGLRSICPSRLFAEYLPANEPPQLAAARHADSLAYRGSSMWNLEFEHRMNQIREVFVTILNVLERKLADAVFVQLRSQSSSLENACDNLRCLGVRMQEIQIESDSLEIAVRRPFLNTRALIEEVRLPSPELSEQDKILVALWARNEGNTDYALKKMQSARKAELAALELYKRVNPEATDLSIEQVRAGNDARWKKADILCGNRWIDVKNSRQSFSSDNSYSEWSIPRFKVDRTGTPVTISAFLSVYDPERSQEDNRILWLGECSTGLIAALRSQFESPYLHLDFERSDTTALPPWMFDYPSWLYPVEDQARVPHPKNLAWPHKPLRLGAAVIHGLPLASGEDCVEAVALKNRIASAGGRSRPVLFMHVLDRFCRSIASGEGFQSERILDSLFDIRQRSLDCPLAILDPLECVHELLRSLACVAERGAEQCTQFRSFRLAGPRIVQGRPSSSVPWQTILAYCGGWRTISGERRVKCGSSPLVLGSHDLCESCSHLICNDCKFCSSRCPECGPRQASK